MSAFFGADALVAHAVGDYILQSHYMATNKTTKIVAALVHVLTYALPFLFITRSVPALVFIAGTHFVIDHWRLARHVIWLKNFIGPMEWVEVGPVVYGDGRNHGRIGPTNRRMVWRSTNVSWAEARENNGFPATTPMWMSFWLMVIVDNLCHILLNGAALQWLT